MNTIIFQAILLSCLAFVNVEAKTFCRIIPEQEVQSQQEILWTKPVKLQGNYDLKILIYLDSELLENEIVISLDSSFGHIRNSTASIDTLDGFSVFMLDAHLVINREDHINIYYIGTKILEIKSVPQSSVILTKLSSIANKNTTMTNAAKQSAKTTVIDLNYVIPSNDIYFIKLLLILILLIIVVDFL